MSAPPRHLDPYKGNMFRIREYSDQIVEFIFDDSGMPTGLKITAGGNSVLLTRKK
jgi:hypothetical protein